MLFTVYQTTNLINNKLYCGVHITNDPNDGYLGSGKIVSRAINKYQPENFKKEILFVFDNPEDMFAKEKELVNEEWINRKDTYNIKLGGEGGWDYVNRNKFHLHENKDFYKKVSLALKGRKASEACYAAVSQAHKDGKFNYNTFEGKTHTKETKNKIGKANSFHQSGKKNSQYGTCWITNGQENKKIKKENLDKYIQLGYNKGRIMVSVV